MLILVVIVTYTLLCWEGTARLEDSPRSLLESLQIVVETFTTVGYGGDAALWESPPMIALMVGMQFTGVFFVFLALPLFVVPWIERRLEVHPPMR